MESVAKEEWARLSIISQEYSLLQISKLHDPAVMSGNITLGIDYIFTYGGWPHSVRTRLKDLKKALDHFGIDKIRGVRNKALSHNDLATIVTGATLGDFEEGAAKKYFEALQEFVSIVHDQVVGGPYPFSYLVRNDVAYFLRAIKPLSPKKQSDGLTSPPTPRA